MTTASRPEFSLGLSFIQTTGHVEGWRLSAVDSDKERFDYYLGLTRLIEDAGFHYLFLGDSISGSVNVGRGWTPSPEPIALSTALATHTTTLGFVPSASSLYNDPFALARSLATLDHISEGRAGWNNLTSFYPDTAQKAFTLGRELTKDVKYAAADEFLDVIRRLWRAWEPGASLRNHESGFYIDPQRRHPIDYRGERFSVLGAPSVTRSPQTEPVIFQPVSSAEGQISAAKNAEVVFNRQNNLEDARDFYRETKRIAATHGRSADSISINPGLVVVIGETERDAQRQLEDVRRFIDPGKAIAELRAVLDWGDELVPTDAASGSWPALRAGASGRARALYERARHGGLTVEDLAYEASSARGFALFVGTAEQVGAEIEQWHAEEGVDGFVIGPVVAPDGVEPITRDLVPELRRRGLIRDAEGATFRERLGLTGLPFSD